MSKSLDHKSVLLFCSCEGRCAPPRFFQKPTSRLTRYVRWCEWVTLIDSWYQNPCLKERNKWGGTFFLLCFFHLQGKNLQLDGNYFCKLAQMYRFAQSRSTVMWCFLLFHFIRFRKNASISLRTEQIFFSSFLQGERALSNRCLHVS